MQQLTGLDTTFLNIETPTTYGHIGGLVVFDPTTSNAQTDDHLGALKDLINERIHLVPPYRRRLVEVPFGIDQPYWIEDPDFDLNFHVRHIGLPPPGTDKQLAELVSRIMARPLDRGRPLWELYLIEGLENGYIAQLSKIHHSAIDGVSGMEILASLLDVEPEPAVVEPPAKAWRPDKEPKQLQMLGRGVRSVATRPAKGIRLWRDIVTSLPTLVSVAATTMPIPKMLQAPSHRDKMLSHAPTSPPRTSFNGTIGPDRTYAFASLPLADVRAIKTAHEVTLNDVVMAMCSSALRRYLLDNDELPEDPLIAMVPVSVRTEGTAGTNGNQVSTMTASLHTDIEDPVERLRAIHESMLIAKETHNALPATLQQDFAEFSPPAVAARAARAITRAAANSIIGLPYNLVISNVPGPQFPLYGVGARMVANYPVSTITDGSGLNITVQSYDGNLDIGILACRDAVPDVWGLIDHLRDAVDELKPAPKKKPTKKAAAKKKPAPKKQPARKKAAAAK